MRANADGFYANFIQLLPTVGNPQSLCNQIEPLMTNKNAYFESDSRYTGLGGFPNGGQYTLATEAQEMNELLGAGFAITYTSLNYGVDPSKQSQCKTLGLPTGTTRPCVAQNGPWTFNGNVRSADPRLVAPACAFVHFITNLQFISEKKLLLKDAPSDTAGSRMPKNIASLEFHDCL